MVITKVLAIIGFLAVVLGLFLYMGWFGFSSSNNDGQLDLRLDKTQLKDDATKAKKDVEDLGRAAEEKARDAAAKIKESVKK
ncbi:MAG TPA: hypothetical protein VGP72_16320 [Planctomycetota bacterium]